MKPPLLLRWKAVEYSGVGGVLRTSSDGDEACEGAVGSAQQVPRGHAVRAVADEHERHERGECAARRGDGGVHGGQCGHLTTADDDQSGAGVEPVPAAVITTVSLTDRGILNFWV